MFHRANAATSRGPDLKPACALYLLTRRKFLLGRSWSPCLILCRFSRLPGEISLVHARLLRCCSRFVPCTGSAVPPCFDPTGHFSSPCRSNFARLARRRTQLTDYVSALCPCRHRLRSGLWRKIYRGGRFRGALHVVTLPIAWKSGAILFSLPYPALYSLWRVSARLPSEKILASCATSDVYQTSDRTVLLGSAFRPPRLRTLMIAASPVDLMI